LYGGIEENGGRAHLKLSMFEPGVEFRISRITTSCAVKGTENIVVRRITLMQRKKQFSGDSWVMRNCTSRTFHETLL
jgi:hypothetical protein